MASENPEPPNSDKAALVLDILALLVALTPLLVALALPILETLRKR